MSDKRPVVGKETVRQVLEKFGMADPFLLDEQYELVDLVWFESIRADLWRWLAKRVGNFEPNISECNHYALTAYEEILFLYRIWKDRTRECAPAVARISYKATDTKGHQLLVLLFWAGPNNTVDDIGVAFFDPQPRVSGYVATIPPDQLTGSNPMLC